MCDYRLCTNSTADMRLEVNEDYTFNLCKSCYFACNRRGYWEMREGELLIFEGYVLRNKNVLFETPIARTPINKHESAHTSMTQSSPSNVESAQSPCEPSHAWTKTEPAVSLSRPKPAKHKAPVTTTHHIRTPYKHMTTKTKSNASRLCTASRKRRRVQCDSLSRTCSSSRLREWNNFVLDMQ